LTTNRSNDGLVRVVVVVLGILVLFPVLMMALAVPTIGMMAWWGDGMVGGFSPLWGLVMMLVWVVVLFAIGYLLYRGLAGGIGRKTEADPALEELRLAYARGDISEEEFEERRTRLQREE
jgi:putative membrane protein